jgi:hypothetical protein
VNKLKKSRGDEKREVKKEKEKVAKKVTVMVLLFSRVTVMVLESSGHEVTVLIPPW